LASHQVDHMHGTPERGAVLLDLMAVGGLRNERPSRQLRCPPLAQGCATVSSIHGRAPCHCPLGRSPAGHTAASPEDRAREELSRVLVGSTSRGGNAVCVLGSCRVRTGRCGRLLSISLMHVIRKSLALKTLLLSGMPLPREMGVIYNPLAPAVHAKELRRRAYSIAPSRRGRAPSKS